MLAKSRATASLVFALALLTSALPVLPGEANSFLVFRKDKQTKRTADRSQMVWHSSTAPIPGKNIPEDCTVIEIPAELRGKPIQELKRAENSFIKLVHEPKTVVAPPPTEEQVAHREVEETLRTASGDSTITDVEYARLLRISKMEDPAAKKEAWLKIKDKLKR